ncbi:unnamed protein product, partial [Didymodactylos carnosus]
TIDYMENQIELFNRFTEQSTANMQTLDDTNVDLLGKLEDGWVSDRKLENAFAQKDLEYIEHLTNLLKLTEKRKDKIGTVVHRLVGELQHLKYYLEGMSSPEPRPPRSHSARKGSFRRRSISNERVRSAGTPAPLADIISKRQRASSANRAKSVSSATSPYPTHTFELDGDVQRRVTIFVEDNFDVKSNKKSSQRSARTDFSSWKSTISTTTPDDEADNEMTKTKQKVAFAET